MGASKQNILNRYGLNMPIKAVAHVCIKTTDLDATTEFYCGALGMAKHFNFTKKGKIIGFYMKTANETFIEVFLAGEVDQINKQTIHHFCLETNSIEALRNSLVQRGYAPGPIKVGADGTPQFWMKDPSGMALEFQEYTVRSSQLTGQDVEVDW